MENVRLKFFGVKATEEHTIETFCNEDNLIYLEIDMNLDHQYGSTWITLNKATAVQLVKKLKLEISKIDLNK